jgi:hypothetical protein
MSQLLTDLDRKVAVVVGHDACRSMPNGQGIAASLPYHLEALPQPLDQGLLLMWALVHVVNRQAAQIDRLERLAMLIAGPPIETLTLDAPPELFEALRALNSLRVDVSQRVAAEAKAREAATAKEGAH